jgi:RNA-splicing ligase RtcB
MSVFLRCHIRRNDGTGDRGLNGNINSDTIDIMNKNKTNTFNDIMDITPTTLSTL